MPLRPTATLAGLSFVCFCACDFHRIGGASAVGDDIDELARLIRLDDSRPSRARWQTADLEGDDRALFAVLEFDDERLRALAESATAAPRPALTFNDGPPAWFPAELRRRLILESAGRYVFDGPAWEPRRFARAPLRRGFMARIGDSRELFLYLVTD